MKKTRRKRPIRQRFDAKWKWNHETDCWEWCAGISAKGYGTFLVEGKEWYAHRAAWLLYRGPIPDGLVLDHMCRVRNCVNPDHLRLVTLAVNSMENSVGPVAQNAKKTHCKHGHALTGTNLAIRTSKTRYGPRDTYTYRACRICANNATKKVIRVRRAKRIAAGDMPRTKNWKGKPIEPVSV